MGHALQVVVDRRKGAGLGMRIEVEWLWPSLTVGMRGRVVMGARAVDNMLDFSGPERPQKFARLLGFFVETC